jgi:hypothetical protein
MIIDYVNNLANIMGIHLSDAIFVDGRTVGCSDAHLLKLSSAGHHVNILIYQSELDGLRLHNFSDIIEVKARIALNKLMQSDS